MPLGLVIDPRPRSMRVYRADLPPELESLVLRSLAWEPQNRPTAAELAAALAPMLDWLDDTAPGTSPKRQEPAFTLLLPPAQWPG